MSAEMLYPEDYIVKTREDFASGEGDAYSTFLAAVEMDMEQQFCHWLNGHYTLQDIANELPVTISEHRDAGDAPDSDEWREDMDEVAGSEFTDCALFGSVYEKYFDFYPWHFTWDCTDKKTLKTRLLSLMSDTDFIADVQEYREDGNGRYPHPMDEMAEDIDAGNAWLSEAFATAYDVLAICIMRNYNNDGMNFYIECNNMVCDYATEAYQAVLDGTISISD